MSPMPAPSAGCGDLLDAARALAPLVEADADAADQQCTLTRRTVDAFVEHGLHAIALPRELGGAEADFDTQIAVYEEISRADGSAGWCLMAGAVSSAFAAAYMGDAAVREMFEGRTGVIHAGQLAPRGMAEREAGGYRVNGQWSFGSGCAHSAYILGSCMEMADGQPLIHEASGLPEMLVVCLPREKVELLDNWNVMGLRGTGSFDYAIADRHVPAEYTFPLLRAEPRRGGPLYRTGIFVLTAAGHTGFALGVGRRALDEIRSIAAGKQRLGNALLNSQPTFQRDFARAEAQLRSARFFVLDAFGQALRLVEAGDDLTLESRALVRLATTHATEVAAQAARFAYQAAGSDALRNPSVLQRAFRDLHTGTQHIFVDDKTYTDAAQVLLGIAPSFLPL